MHILCTWFFIVITRD